MNELRPTLIFDGDCGICRAWVDYWHQLTGELVLYRPYQEAGKDFPHIPLEEFKRAMQLVEPDGKTYAGAAATFRLLTYAPARSWWWWLYGYVPGFAPVTEAAYSFISKRRGLLASITRVLWGRTLEPESYALVSWLFLHGRCAHCGAPISARYPLVELLTGLLSAWVAARFGFGFAAVAALILTWFLIALTFIDIDHQLLPDSLTLPLLWLGLTLSLWGPQGGATVPVDIRSSLIGAVVGYLSLWSVYHLFRLVTGKEGMGYGDFKLLAALGAWLGWQMLLPVILIAAVVGAIVGVVMLAIRRQSRATPIPFGPFLAAAGWLALMFGHGLVGRYLALFAPQP
jgi:leader peptidase (prepilin peptidase)/N-methyltransferase